MKKWTVLLLIVSGVFAITWLNFEPQIIATEPAPAAAVAADDDDDDALQPIDVSMHDLMEGMFQAPYRRLKVAMEKEPTDGPAWKALRSDALILAEASNMLILRKPETDVEAWIKYSVDARSAGAEVVKSAKKQDFTASKAAYVTMLDHCNACHKQFEKGKHILKP
ncbi:MAG: hypothetical protein Q8M16_17710 [Pirellulaceae bacterium]|nr:hypothetical protein [Pirellulaceae bacterium]